MIEIKKFDYSHIEGILKIENECFEEPWSRKSIEEQLENPNAVYYVVIKNNEVVAYAGMWRILDECDINNIGVLKKERRNGYASMLLEKLINYMNEENLNLINLEVRVSNAPAIALYKKYGFYEAGVRKKYYQGREDALLLRRDRVEHTGD